MIPVPAPERLILSCLRPTSPTADAALGRLPPCDAGWDALLHVAERHGLLPLLANRLRRRGVPLPATVAARLRRIELVAAARGSLLLAELARLVARFASRDIAVVPWKGVALAEAAYGDIGLRDPGDLDLLVSRRDALRAIGLLKAEGFVPYYRLSPRQEISFVANHGALLFTRGADGAAVDLNWSPWEPDFRHPFTADALISHAVTSSVGGTVLPALPPEEHLALLCVHGCKHRWQRLVWASDLAGLLRRRPDIDFRSCLATASRLRVRRILLVGLSLAAELFEATLPPVITRLAEADRAVRSLVRAGLSTSFAAPPEGPSPRAAGVAFLAYRLRALDRPLDRAAFLGRLLWATNPNDWSWMALPDRLFPLYALLRPARLLLRAGSGRRPAPPLP